MRQRTSRLSVTLGLLLFTPVVAFAQASLSGTVRDTSGAVLPGVSVEASSPAFQSIAGPPISALYVVSNAEVMKSLPRGLSGGRTTVVVNLVAPGTMYGERLNQVDLRFSKLFRWGRSRITANPDIYNALNSDTVLRQSNAFGNWQTPFALIAARFAKIGIQADF
jgi:hypothetical protein